MREREIEREERVEGIRVNIADLSSSLQAK
jgi:hypothetical protein